jgi:alanyl-tRNA synthetase
MRIVLALVIALTACHKNEPAATAAQKAPPATFKDVGQCIEVTRQQAVGMSQFTYSMVKTIANHGGKEAVEALVSEKERLDAAMAIKKLYDYAQEKSKCWNLTKGEAIGFLTATNAMAKYIKKNDIIDDMVKLMVAVTGGREESAAAAMDSALKVQEVLMKYVGVTPPSDTDDTY